MKKKEYKVIAKVMTNKVIEFKDVARQMIESNNEMMRKVNEIMKKVAEIEKRIKREQMEFSK